MGWRWVWPWAVHTCARGGRCRIESTPNRVRGPATGVNVGLDLKSAALMVTRTPAYFDERKASQAAAFLLFRAGGRLPVIKLIKLMYLAERLSLKRYGETLTGDRLVAMPHGPVLSYTYDLIQGAYEPSAGGWDTWVSDRAGHDVELNDKSMIRSPEDDLLALSESDLEVLSEVWGEFGHWDRFRLRDFTHSGACPEWTDPNGSSTPLTYRHVLSCLGYSPESAAAIADRIAQQQALSVQMAAC